MGREAAARHAIVLLLVIQMPDDARLVARRRDDHVREVGIVVGARDGRHPVGVADELAAELAAEAEAAFAALEAGEAGADYVAFGAFFPSTTKDKGDAERPTPDILQWWSQIFELPCVAIGGITPDNCGELIAAGADFLAVSGAVWNGDETAAVQAFVKVLEGQ